jgi:glycosyltransferase involved in cell wall biosynthesis
VPYDREATIAAIAGLLRNADLRRSLSQGALRAAARSSWDAVCDAQLAVYEEAVGASLC